MENITTKVYSAAGKEVASLALPGSIWGLPWNADLVHQVVIGMQSNARTGLAHAKMRGEVSGTGKKPWRQKGTGQARHGSRRSPIWVGGGVSHGPRSDKNYDKKINRKMRTKALFVTLSQKLRDDHVLFVNSLDLKAIKTKDATTALKALAGIAGFNTINTAKKNNILLVVPAKNDILAKSFRNIFHVTVEEVRNINPVDIMNYRYVIVADPEASNQVLEAKTVSKSAKEGVVSDVKMTKVKATAPKSAKKPAAKPKAEKVAKKVTAKAKAE